MTWREYLEKVLMRECSSFELAQNIIGDLMDQYGSYDWDAAVPFSVNYEA